MIKYTFLGKRAAFEMLNPKPRMRLAVLLALLSANPIIAETFPAELNDTETSICTPEVFPKVAKYLAAIKPTEDDIYNIEAIAFALEDAGTSCRRQLFEVLMLGDRILALIVGNYETFSDGNYDTFQDFITDSDTVDALILAINEVSDITVDHYFHIKIQGLAQTQNLAYTHEKQSASEKTEALGNLVKFLNRPGVYIERHSTERFRGSIETSEIYARLHELHRSSIDAEPEELDALLKTEEERIEKELVRTRIRIENERIEREQLAIELRQSILPNTQLLDHELGGDYPAPSSSEMKFRYNVDSYLGRCGNFPSTDGGTSLNGGKVLTCPWPEGTDGFVKSVYAASTTHTDGSISGEATIIRGSMTTSARGGYKEDGKDENQTARISATLSGELVLPVCKNIDHCSTAVIISRIPLGSGSGITILVNGSPLYEGKYVVADRSNESVVISTKLARSGQHIGASGTLPEISQDFELFVLGSRNRGIPAGIDPKIVPLPPLTSNADICAHYTLMDDDTISNNLAASIYLRRISQFTLYDIMNQKQCYLDLIKVKIFHIDNDQFYDLIYLELYEILQRIDSENTTPIIRNYMIALRRLISRTLVESRFPIVTDRLETRNSELETLKLVNFSEIAANLELQKSLFSNSRETLLVSLLKIRNTTEDTDIISEIESYVDNTTDFDNFFDRFLALLREKQDRIEVRITDIKQDIAFYNFEMNQFGKIMDLK